MANVPHSGITDDSSNHEWKGAAGATATNVYVADGSGSGAWQPLSVDHQDFQGFHWPSWDASPNVESGNHYVPYACTLVGIRTATGRRVGTSGGSMTLQFRISASGVTTRPSPFLTETIARVIDIRQYRQLATPIALAADSIITCDGDTTWAGTDSQLDGIYYQLHVVRT